MNYHISVLLIMCLAALPGLEIQLTERLIILEM